MKAKETAKTLINQFSIPLDHIDGEQKLLLSILAKEFAITCVGNIISALELTTNHLTLNHNEICEVIDDMKYWEDVITEINKL